jgi:PPM family protein phosphatase
VGPAERVDTLAWAQPPALGQAGLRYGAASMAGAARGSNQDSFLVAPPMFVVADGMGGHLSGDVASRIVVDRFADLVTTAELSVEQVSACIDRCQDEVGGLVAADGPAPGTTLVAAALIRREGASHWLVANVGDSRAYRWAEGQLRQISHDHSVVQELIDAGRIDAEQARSHPERNVITRAIGIDHVGADYSLMPLGLGSRLLLCSDGVSSALTDLEIGAVLADADDPGEAARRLVADARGAGGVDDATAVVVDVVRVDEPADRPATSQAEVDTVPSGGAR